MSSYHFRDIEDKWRKRWKDEEAYKTSDDKGLPKYYVLDMFPYPSGAGLHVGHPLGYIASDIVARYKRLNGYNVLHPMGFDAFGLPAEQYAIQTGQHPAVTTAQNIKRYKEQLDNLGFSFDWSREVKTSDPEYYRWTQWIFIQLFHSWYNPHQRKAQKIESLIRIFEKEGFDPSADLPLTGNIEHTLTHFSAQEWKGFSAEKQEEILQNFRLAYLNEAYVNWCPALGTVLANEEVKDGVSERGGHPVERKLMKQWSLRITAYADRLLEGLDQIDWSDAIKEQQRNWIGKSEGCSICFKLAEHEEEIEVFSTRPDTIFGATFLTLAPEHELVEKITSAEQKQAVETYVNYAKNRSERDRMSDVKTVSGCFTGAYVKHPFSDKNIPVWIGDYVLAGYGTGAVMGVPAHDSRDFLFAKHFGLEIIQVVKGANDESIEENSYDAKEGKLINSDFLDGLDVKAAIKKAIAEIEQKGIGKGKTNYRLRDAVFGRQRYWGEPIPVYYENGLPKTMAEESLPLELPAIDKFLPTEDGEPPLARAEKWHWDPEHRKLTGKEDGFPLETTTMPGWAGSSWYFLRYMDPHNNETFASREALQYWKQVDLYIGGSEHATGHLLYARFWTKFLFDLGHLEFEEPVKKLINQGMIQGVSEKIFSYLNLSQRKSSYGESDRPANEREGDPRDGETFYYENLLPSFLDDYKVLANKNFLRVLISHNFIQKLTDNDVNALSILNVPIEYCSNSRLVEFEKYIRHLNEASSGVVFVNPDGVYMDNKFYDLNGSELEQKEFEFYTKPEVEKMSKSKWNVVNPDDICNNYGADTLRLYEMFLGPLEQSKPWNTNGIEGVYRFLGKLWRLFFNEKGEWHVSDEEANAEELKVLHKTIKKTKEDIENYAFNTSVSAFMICVNELAQLKCNKRSILEPLLVCISPYAPHITEELWSRCGNKESILRAKFPEHNDAYLVENTFSYPVSINGKTRLNIDFALDLTQEEIQEKVLADEQVQKWMEGKPMKKFVFVKGRIINVVVG